MPIDPSIIMGLKPATFATQDPLDAAQKSLALQHLMGQQELQGVQVEQARQGMDDNTRLRALLASNPKDLPGELARAGFLDKSLQVQKDLREGRKVEADTTKSAAEAKKIDFDVGIRKLEHGAAVLGTAKDQASYDQAISVMAQSFGPESVAQMPPQFDPGYVQASIARGLTRAQQLADERAAAQQAETGRHNLTTEGLTAAQQAEVARNNLVQNRISQGHLGIAGANLGLARERLAMERDAPKGTYDSERGIIVDTRAGQARPVTMDGQPVGPKDKNLNDSQAKAQLFAARMAASEKVFDELARAGTTTNVPGMRGSYGVGSTVTALSTANQQRLDQAKRDFINAVLRKESGAVISPSEFDNAEKQYFPQVGDAKSVIEQKAANRKLAQAGIMAEVPERLRTPGVGAPATRAARPVSQDRALADAIIQGR